MNIRKRGKTRLPAELPLVHKKPVPISKGKKKDLLDLLPFIDPAFHYFYVNLKTNDILSTDPDLEEIDPDACI